MSLPLFLDFEASSPEPDAYPVAAAWSLPDGRIKSVLIIPEDEWMEREGQADDLHYGAHADLYLHGVSALDVIREMNEDLHDQAVCCDGLSFDEIWLERLFDAYGLEPAFELTPVTQQLVETPTWEWDNYRRTLFDELGLEPHKAEDEVRVMQQVFLRLQGQCDGA